VAWPKNDPQQILKRSKEVVCRGHDLHQMPAKWRHLTASRLAKKNKTAAKNDHFGSKMAKKKDLHQDFKRSKEVVCM
jgi:hypothetical protein